MIDWTELGRSDAVSQALIHCGESTIAEILDCIARRGRDDPKALVSAALAHLKKRGKAHSVGHGRWAPGGGAVAEVGASEPAPVSSPGDVHQLWDCTGCGERYDSPVPIRQSWHQNCPKAKARGMAQPRKRVPA